MKSQPMGNLDFVYLHDDGSARCNKKIPDTPVAEVPYGATLSSNGSIVLCNWSRVVAFARHAHSLAGALIRRPEPSFLGLIGLSQRNVMHACRPHSIACRRAASWVVLLKTSACTSAGPCSALPRRHAHSPSPKLSPINAQIAAIA